VQSPAPLFSVTCGPLKGKQILQQLPLGRLFLRTVPDSKSKASRNGASAGRKDVCSVCGDDPAEDLKIVREKLPVNAVASIRLCGHCRKIRGAMHGESYEPLIR
jgi:hypothetical protein